LEDRNRQLGAENLKPIGTRQVKGMDEVGQIRAKIGRGWALWKLLCTLKGEALLNFR
jgi:hypothetical protein